MNWFQQLALIGDVVRVLTSIRLLNKGDRYSADVSIRYTYKGDSYRIKSITVERE